MIARAVLTAGACAIAFASGWGNYLHVQNSGAALISAVIAAECFKFAMPWAFREQLNANNGLGVFATIVVWLAALAFSVLNTFGNAVTRRADAQAAIADSRAAKLRPMSEVLADLNRLPPVDCTPRTRVQSRWEGKGRDKREVRETVTLELSPLCGTKEALQTELELSQKATIPGEPVQVHASDDSVRDGLVLTASMWGYYLNPKYAPLYVVMIWCAFMELCSSLVVLAIPGRKP